MIGDTVLQLLQKKIEAHEQPIADLEAKAWGDSVRHVSAARAAEQLGIDVRSVRRLVESGQLLGRRLVIPGSKRRRWVVNALALKRFVGSEPGLPAAPAAEI